MSKLLSTFSNIILPIIVLVVAIGLCFLLYRYLKKSYGKYNKGDVKKKLSGTPQVKLKKEYCSEDEMKFLEAIHKALPRECISFPNVGVSKLIEPKGNLIGYNSVINKFVDICVFLRKDMSPILVIDLYSQSPVAQQFKKFDDSVSAVLKELKIPVIHKQIQANYNIDELRYELLQAMSGTTVAFLKNTVITDQKK